MITVISYEPFWTTIGAYEISTYTLIKKHHISANTINRLKHNKPIDTKTIEKLCKAVKCNVYDILEYVPDEEIPTGAKSNIP